MITPNLYIDEILEHWPGTIYLFFEYKMACVGCSMSAFDTFSSQLFAESIDRIKIGENLILVNPVESFLVCYVIKGQSYLGLQKLNRFSEAIKNNSEIWERLTKAVQTGEELDLNNPPSLGDTMSEIFSI